MPSIVQATSSSRSSLDIFSHPLSHLSWDRRENKPYGRAMAKTETHPACLENKPNTPSPKALLLGHRKCCQDLKDVPSRVNEQPCFALIRTYDPPALTQGSSWAQSCLKWSPLPRELALCGNPDNMRVFHEPLQWWTGLNRRHSPGKMG